MTVKLSFVIPTYNRKDNLYIALHGLVYQSRREFEVIVCDDGSEDGSFNVLSGFEKYFPLKYYRQTHEVYGTPRLRNQGTRLARPGTTHLWYLDSDVVLNPEAVKLAWMPMLKNPATVIAGMYHWMSPRRATPALVKDWPAFIANTRVYEDSRKAWNNEKILASGAALSGNLIVPMCAFLATGGFDEEAPGAYGDDCEFGHALRRANIMMLLNKDIVGYHQHHAPAHSSEERRRLVRETIRYVHEKYNIPLDEERHLPPLAV